MDAVQFTTVFLIVMFCHIWTSAIRLVRSEVVEEDQGMTTHVSVNKGVASLSDMTWNLPRPVLPYQSYMDVYPTRYDIPPGISGVTWAFQLMASARNCKNLSVHFLLQQGGLPLVNQSSQSFPDNYYIPSASPLLHFDLNLDLNHMSGFFTMRPSAGSWYVIAYTNEDVDGRIRQKGLHKDSSRCLMNYMSNIQFGPRLQTYLLSPGHVYTINVTRQGTLISFSLPTSVYAYQISISNCDVYNCSLALKSIPFNLKRESSQNCHSVDTTACHLRVPSPTVGEEQVFALSSTSHDIFNVQIQISLSSCINYKAFHKTPCVTLFPLSRINTISPGISSMGNMFLSFISPQVSFGWTRTLLIPFHILEPNDIGNTLSWYMRVASFGKGLGRLEKDLEIHVCGGLVYNYLPDLDDDTFDVCQNLTQPVRVSSIGGVSRNQSILHVPYPRVGVWHIVLQATCFLMESGTEVSCPLETSVDMTMNINRCIQNECGGRGDCHSRTVGSELVFYSACKCYADYHGYGCQDNSDALSTSVQLAGAFLLTMSNFLFLPAIAIAAKRRFFLEAFAYAYTMAFSAFYHACDGDRIEQYRLCIIPFSVLQSADFFGSSCSVWITLIAMAAIRIRYLTPVLQVMGPFGLFIGVVYDKTSLWVIASPIVAGTVVLMISWGIKMYKRKALYPSKRRYLFFLLPGLVLAITAAVIYSFLETQANYKYLHSMWHVSIALSICFLLPPRNGLVVASKDDDTMTTPLTRIVADDGQRRGSSICCQAETESPSDSRMGDKENDNDGASLTCTDATESPQH